MTAILPDVFVRPDLGPRATISHGVGVRDSAPDVGTVHLHLEKADSLSALVHVGDLSLRNASPDQIIKSLSSMECIGGGDESSGDDDAAASEFDVRERISEGRGSIGCVWHVFHPADADKIRDYLNKLTNEDRRKKLDPSHDPLHNPGSSGGTNSRAVYLDAAKRRALKEDYGVEPFTVHQFAGEALFFPAGSPRQAKHLESCVSVNVDFASPESLPRMFHLVQAMRAMPASQELSEDKLQIKNIVFHAVKSALAVLKDEEAGEGSNGVDVDKIKAEDDKEEVKKEN